MSAFYSEENKNLGENLIRFCFFKVPFYCFEALVVDLFL